MILVEKSNLVDGINKIKNHTTVKSTDQSVNFTGRIFYLFPPQILYMYAFKANF